MTDEKTTLSDAILFSIGKFNAKPSLYPALSKEIETVQYIGFVLNVSIEKLRSKKREKSPAHKITLKYLL